MQTRSVLTLAIAGASLLSPIHAGTVTIESGTAAFDVATNVPAVTVEGKSKALRGKVEMSSSGGRLLIERVEAWLPVKTLATGMGIRDEHMRKYVFTTPDGQTPDLRFTAHDLTCPATPGREAVCEISGDLSVRGVERPFRLGLKVRQENGSTAAFRASGDGTLKLSDYGIEAPSQLGVRTANDVKLHIEFTGKETAAVAASGGRR
jgi:polyisoprenoid-binding protein YceI